MKLPKKNSGVLIGGDVHKPEMASIARSLSDLGFNLYCSSKEIEQFIATLPYVRKAKRVEFPLKDKRRLHQVFEDHEIQLVINLAKARGKDVLDEDYVARRNAVDFGIMMYVRFPSHLLCNKLKSVPQDQQRSMRSALCWRSDKAHGRWTLPRLRGRQNASRDPTMELLLWVLLGQHHDIDYCFCLGKCNHQHSIIDIQSSQIPDLMR